MAIVVSVTDLTAVEQASEEFQRLWEETLGDLDAALTPTQLRVLLMIDRSGPLRLGELADGLAASPSSVSKVVDRLEAGGFVQRTAGVEDARVVGVGLSTAGTALAGWIHEHHRATLAAVLDRMDARGRAALVSGLAEFDRTAAARSN